MVLVVCLTNIIIYIGDVTLLHNNTVYQNNSLFALEDLGQSLIASLICLTNRFPCCQILTDGSWHHPDGSRVLTSGNNFYQLSFSTQALVLFRTASTVFPSGMFYCEVVDEADVRRNLYIGIYRDGTGK